MDTLVSWLGVPLGHLMRLCWQGTGNYALSVLLLTLAVKILLLPLGIWVHFNSIRVVRIQPELNEARARYFGDADAIAEAQGRLFKQQRYHPLANLIPLFVQIVLLMGLVDVIYHPFNHLLRLRPEEISALVQTGCNAAGLDASARSVQLSVLSALHSGQYAQAFAALDLPEAVIAAQSVSTVFLGLDLGDVPAVAGGALLVMPLLAGLSSYLLCVAQNRSNVLQSEQGKINKYGTMAFSVGLSLYLGAFVPAGVAIYWMASNLLSIVQLYLLNAVFSPRRYVDYERLEASKKALSELRSVGGKRSRAEIQRERADYKRFFSIANKHLVFYSEGSGFYKYYEKVISELLRRSNIVIHYVTSDPNDQIFALAEKNERIQPYYIGDKKLITLFMKMDADVVVMTMPDLENFHYKRSYVRKDITYIYMVHYPLSTHMVLRSGALDHYDEVLCVGEFQFDEIRAAERLHGTKEKKLIACGYGQLENLYDAYMRMDKTPHSRPHVLIAPSWQANNILDTCIDDVLHSILGKGYRVTVRPHPEYKKRYRARLDALMARWQAQTGDELIFETDFSGNDSIYGADALITDWSGTAYEYSLVTLKPSIFIDTPPKINNPEYEKLGIEPLEFSLRDRIGTRVSMENAKHIDQAVAQALAAGKQYEADILAIREQYIACFGSSGKAGYRAIMDAVKAHQNTQERN